MKISISRVIISVLFLVAVIPLILSSASQTALGIANPAAVYCENLGYEYTTEETPEGERGLCQLPNGEAVDAWQFLKGKVAQEYSYCGQKGYQIKTVKDFRICTKFGIEECAVCILEDGKEVEVTELMGLELSNPKCIRFPIYLIIIIAAVVVVLIITIVVFIRKRKARSAAQA
jgi:putative hemolysin